MVKEQIEHEQSKNGMVEADLTESGLAQLKAEIGLHFNDPLEEYCGVKINVVPDTAPKWKRKK